MIDTFQAAVLGVVQGVSEPLPISSSGHLILVPWLFDWSSITSDTAFNKTFDVALHLGTLIGIVAYFWRDVGQILAAAWRSLRGRSFNRFEERLPWYIALATIPGFVFGALGAGLVEGPLGDPVVISINLIVFGIVLWVADRYARHKRVLERITAKDSGAIGVAQAVALMPGVSRSGITMTTGLGLGLTRDAAARFSFLISIPVVAGAVAYSGLKTFVFGDGLPAGAGGPFLVGIVTSTVTGFAAVWFLLRYIRKHTFTPFVVWRVAFGVFCLIVAGVRW